MCKINDMVEYNGKIVTIMSCSDCNVKCKHCYISYKGNFESKKLIELVKSLRSKHRVIINGTEPLLHKGYLRAMSLAKQIGPLTNGLIFKNNYTYLDEIKKQGMKTIYISYHFDFHEKVSMVDKVYLQNLFKEIKSRGLNFIIMCTITSENYLRISQYCEQAYQMGACAIRFTNFINQGLASNLDKNLILRDDQLKDFFSLINNVRKKYDINKFRIMRCGTFGADENNLERFSCNAGVDNVCITPDGNVYPCVFLAKPGYEIGNVINNKVYINKYFKNRGGKCLVKEICNNKNNKIFDNLIGVD